MSRVSPKAGALLLLGVGAGLALLAASSPWARLSAEDGLVGASVTVTGSALAPLSVALGVVGLAAVPAAMAVPRWLRAVVALVVVTLGLVALAQAVGVATDIEAAARSWWRVEVGALASSADVAATAWPYVTMVAVALAVAGGALILVRGSGWSGLSSRYDAPARSEGSRAAARPSTGADTWQALDRGEDPTKADDEKP